MASGARKTDGRSRFDAARPRGATAGLPQVQKGVLCAIALVRNSYCASPLCLWGKTLERNVSMMRYQCYDEVISQLTLSSSGHI